MKKPQSNHSSTLTVGILGDHRRAHARLARADAVECANTKLVLVVLFQVFRLEWVA
jgi:hypothetical protein